MRSLAKKPEDRFQTARDFRKEIEAVVKDADVGSMETMRMSRDAMAAARTSSGGLARSVAPAKAAPPLKPVPAPTATPADSIADSLEPDAGGGLAPRRGKPWLWLGLGGVVAAAGAAVLVLTMGGGKSPPKKPVAGSGTGSAPLGAFLPADISWSSQKAFAERGLDVRCVAACDLGAIAAMHDDAVARFRAFAERKHPGADKAIAAQPLTVLVVPQRVLCDDRTYETQHAPEGCAREGSYYRPLERTLLVLDDANHLRGNLSSGIAEAICVHQPIAGVCDAIDAFAAESASLESKGSPH
jgi:hypothetical protein